MMRSLRTDGLEQVGVRVETATMSMDLSSWAGMAEDVRLNHSQASLAGNFGLSNVVRLLLVRRYRDAKGIPHQEHIEIENLICTISDPSTAQSMSGIEVENTQIEITGISKTLDRDWLSATGVSFWLNAKMLNDTIVGGQEYNFVTVNDSSPITWSITLQKKPDERRFE